MDGGWCDDDDDDDDDADDADDDDDDADDADDDDDDDGLGWKLDWRFGWILNRRSVSRLDWARVKTGDWFGESGLGMCVKTGQERDMECGMEIGDWIGCCGW